MHRNLRVISNLHMNNYNKHFKIKIMLEIRRGQGYSTEELVQSEKLLKRTIALETSDGLLLF